MREFWSECGAIEALDVMRFPDTGRFKGIAFITFAEVGASCRWPLHCNPRHACPPLADAAGESCLGIHQCAVYDACWTCGLLGNSAEM